jgi:glycine oxidase
MLAPQSEAEAIDPFFELCLAGAKLYRAWSDRLHAESGIDPEYADSGLLFVASTEDALCRLKRNAQWQQSAGLGAEILTPEEAHRLEPHLTLSLTGAILMAAEAHVTPRRLLEALTGACAAKGVEIRTGVRVLEVLRDPERATGVRTSSEHLMGGNVVIASGVWSPEIEGLTPSIPVTPRKGQILSLASSPPAFVRMIRWEHAYVVPRRNGELIVGATNEDVGFDRSITPAGVGSLLDRAQQLSSHLKDLPIQDIWTGLRPSTPDGWPVIGKAGVEGLIYATGHYRNGILLAPVTALSVAGILDNQPPPMDLSAFAPGRYAV